MSSFSSDFQTLIKHLTSFVFSYELLISLRTECDGCVYIFPFQKVKEDPEVVKKRRERNKIAATKCRKRKRERIEKLQQVLLTLRVTSYDCLSLNQKNCLNCTDLSRRIFKPGSLSASDQKFACTRLSYFNRKLQHSTILSFSEGIPNHKFYHVYDRIPIVIYKQDRFLQGYSPSEVDIFTNSSKTKTR